MAGEVVGSVFVRVRAITSKLASDIQEGLDNGVNDVDIDRPAKKLGDDLGGSVSIGVTDAMDAAVPDGIGKVFKRTEKRLARDRTGKTLGERLGFLFNEGFADSLQNLFNNVNKGLSKVSSLVSKFKIPIKPLLYALAVPAIGVAIQTLVVYLVGLVAQLGYLATAAAGAGAAFGGLFLSAGLALPPLILAFKAMSPELLLLIDRAKKVGKRFEVVGLAVQKRLFPALDRLLTDVQKIIPWLTRFGTFIGEFAGKFVDMGRKTVLGTEGLRKLGKIGFVAAGVFERLTEGLGYFLEWIFNLWAAAGPIIVDLAGRLRNMTKRWAEVTRLGEKSGGLTKTLSTWYVRAVYIGQAFGDILHAIWDTFTIGAEASQPFFDTFKNFADRWRTFTESQEGKDRIREIFDNVVPAVQAINGFIAELFRMLFSSSVDSETTGGIAGFFNWLTDEALPWIRDTFMPTIMELKDPIKRFAVALGELFQKLGELGVFERVLDVLILFIDSLTALLELPGVPEIVGGLLVLGTTIGLFGKILAPVLTLFSALSSVFSALVPVFGAIGASLTGAAAGSFAAIATGIGVVILVIAALVAIGYVLYTNWDTISDKLASAWDWLSERASSAWQGITDAVNSARDNFEKIKQNFSDIWDKIVETFNKAKETLGPIIEDITSTIEDLNIGETIAGWIDTIETNIQEIIPIFMDAFETVSGVVEGVMNNILGTIQLVLDIISVVWGVWGDDILAAVEGVWSGISTAISGAINFVSGIIKTVLAVIGGDWGAAWDGIKQTVSGAWDLIAGTMSAAGSVVTGIVRGIVDTIVAPFRWLYNELVGNSIIPDMVDAIVEWLLSIPSKIAGLASSIFDWAKDAAINAALRLAEITNALFTWVTETIASIPEKMLDLATTIWDWTSTAGEKAAEFLGNIFTAITDWLADAPGNLAEAIGGFASSFVDELVDALVGAIDSLPGGGLLKKGLEAIGIDVPGFIVNANLSDLAGGYGGQFDVPQFGAGALVKARRGGVLANIAERGFDEVVLSTDPRYAGRNEQLLQAAGISSGGDSYSFTIVEAADAVRTGAEVARRVRTEKFLHGGRSTSPYRFPRRG